MSASLTPRPVTRPGNAEPEAIRRWSRTEAVYPQDRCVHELVAWQAATIPHQIALDGPESLTYAELERQANYMANHLHNLGVGPEVCVALCLPRSSLQVVAALAALKAGGAYLPLDPSYPWERLVFMLRDAGARVLVTNQDLGQQLSGEDWHTLALDASDARRAAEPVEGGLGTPATADNLAYVIYTSGSTGTPKGVQITHDSLLNLVFWHQRTFGVTPDDRASQVASFGFDAAVWELWPYLTAGATVCIGPDLTRTSPESLRDWLIANEITISFVPTGVAEHLIQLDWPAGTRLRYLLTGADTLHHYPRPGLPFQLINNYGPTESTVVATSGTVPPNDHPTHRPAIGRPIANTQIHILDEQLSPVGIGEIGELCVGGAGVSRGYLNRPALNAQKFIHDSFSERAAARLYRTGDLAYFLDDGQVAYVGRVDDQVKIRGYRVEPNEIVSVLNTHPGVQASTVLAWEDEMANLQLVAYIVGNGSSPLSGNSLRGVVRAQLPDFMVPSWFVQVEALPLTHNGKIDRGQLPAPDATNVIQDEETEAPRTVVEQRLAAIIANLLRRKRVGVNENFFFLGGHSLLGTQLIARVWDAFGVELPLRTIFDSPTARQLAQEIEDRIVAKIAAMSDEEAQSALHEARHAGGGA
jgi:amino acid adenylation domain-containing protein